MNRKLVVVGTVIALALGIGVAARLATYLLSEEYRSPTQEQVERSTPRM